eukprot:TRINITY_DN4220_c0_g1_i1.p2 TRINITY_DN4220_c0_g1~~TRINITY_DN4220_c0_g1_i1.p2  ORF type:complete len:110 (-),score=13.83 TRINITY_DN4220_c0_g1_i1:488-817(-)
MELLSLLLKGSFCCRFLQFYSEPNARGKKGKAQTAAVVELPVGDPLPETAGEIVCAFGSVPEGVVQALKQGGTTTTITTILSNINAVLAQLAEDRSPTAKRCLRYPCQN